MHTSDIMTELTEAEPLDSLIRRLGSPESTILIYSASCVFQIPQVDGAIGYQKIGNCAVVIGDPMCQPENIAELTGAFHRYCQECNLKVVYFLVHEDFAHWSINNGCHTLIQVGEELSINPMTFHKRHKLQGKVNHASRHGVVVKEYKNHDPALESQIKSTAEAWVKGRHGPQIHLGHIDFFSDADHRIFYAQENDRIVGLLLLSPLDSIPGWVVCFHLVVLDAPTGTTECLMCSTFDILASENSHYLCLGIACGSKLGEVRGLSLISKLLAGFIFKVAGSIFRLNARAVYLSKYHPQSAPTFLVSRDKLSLTELFALKKLLNVKL